MRISNNLPALTAFEELNANNAALQKSVRELSTGLRVNSSADDAAGFAISEKMRSEISGLDAAIRNIQDAASMINVADGALGETNSMLQKIRDLCVQASNETLTVQDRQYIQLEIDELREQIDNVARTTQFNKKSILDGSSGALWTSSDSGVKVHVNGGLVSRDEFGEAVSHEGNYRIDISAEAGQAQVMKSSIMLVKHDDVTMDRKTVNTSAGVDNVSVENMPAGNYSLVSEKADISQAVTTGAYGLTLSELNASLKARTRDSALLSNASILFEVTSVDKDNGSITVNASSSILHTDGTTELVTKNDIVLKQGKFTDLSAVLGVGNEGADEYAADGGFELQLTDAGSFSAGSKFVYNLSTAKGTEGADVSVKISGTNNAEAPEMWQEAEEIYRTNLFKPQEPPDTSAKVLFLVDNSGSMAGAFETLRKNISSFLSSIRAEGVSDVSAAVARYTMTLEDSSEWYRTDSELESALAAPPHSAYVDPYQSIMSALDQYDFSDVNAKHIVIITDTGQENTASSATLQDVQDRLASEGITLSAVYANKNAAIKGLLTSGGIDMDIKNQTWGTTLVSELGQQIGQEAVELVVTNTQLNEFKEFAAMFPDDTAPERILTVTKNDVGSDIQISSTDTLKTLTAKLDAATGGTTTVSLEHDESANEAGIVLTTNIKAGSGITFSGDDEVIATLGLRSNLEQKFSLDSDKVINRNIHFKNFYINSESGRVTAGDIVLTTNSTELTENNKLADFEVSYIGQTPKQDVKLRDINNFWNQQGVCMLDHPKTITVTQGNGRTSSITLYETDTLEDVCTKLNDAIGSGLGQSKYTDMNNFVSFVREDGVQAQGDESVAGTLIVRSAVPGRDGELTFSGDPDVLQALGLSVIRESTESVLTASVYDAHSGRVISSGVRASGSEFVSLIPPEIDIEVDPMSGLSANWDESTKRFIMARKDVYSAFIHLKDNGTVFQTGADIGDDFALQLGDFSSDALRLSRINVLSRENASRSIGVVDRAVREVSLQRARLGADTNALERTADMLSVETLNMMNAESRIRSADMARTMMDFVRLQTLNQSGTSVLSQANQMPQSVLSLMGN